MISNSAKTQLQPLVTLSPWFKNRGHPAHAQLPPGEIIILVREPGAERGLDAGNPPVRFDGREAETDHGMLRFSHGAVISAQNMSKPAPPRLP
jgi:hypothetical protein